MSSSFWKEWAHEQSEHLGCRYCWVESTCSINSHFVCCLHLWCLFEDESENMPSLAEIFRKRDISVHHETPPALHCGIVCFFLIVSSKLPGFGEHMWKFWSFLGWHADHRLPCSSLIWVKTTIASFTITWQTVEAGKDDKDSAREKHSLHEN